MKRYLLFGGGLNMTWDVGGIDNFLGDFIYPDEARKEGQDRLDRGDIMWFHVWDHVRLERVYDTRERYQTIQGDF